MARTKNVYRRNSVKMPKGEHIAFSIPEQFNLGSFLLDGNLEAGRGGRTALYHNDDTYTFDDLWCLTNRIGNVLRKLGVEPEHRVLLVLEDSPYWVAAWLATMKIGGVGTNAYTYLHRHDYEYLIDLVRPKVIIVDRITLGKLREATASRRNPPTLLVAGEIEGELRNGEFSLTEMVEAAAETLEAEPTHRDDLAFWNFSSGTTGKPKGVPHKHRDSLVSYQSSNFVLNHTPDDIILSVPKLFFHYSRDNLLFSLCNGSAAILFEDKATTEMMFDLIRKYRPTVLVNVPTMMRAMIQTPEDERADLSCVRRCMSSGEQLSAQLYEDWVDTFGGEVVNRFGSAESTLGYLSNRPGAVVPGSSGTVAPLVEVELVDEDGKEVPVGEPGLLMARSGASGQYYVREHEKSLLTFPGGEWINTGDIFTRDENDYFWYVGRADDMLKVSGVWVSPMEIERGLQTNQSVKEAAVLGVDDKDGLKKIKAFVVLADGTENAPDMPDRLKQFCKESLAPHKFPSAIEFLNDLPKTGQGKIDRRKLREMAL